MKKIFLLAVILLVCVATAQSQEPVKVYRTTEVDAKPNLADGMYNLTMFISKNYKIPKVENKKIRIFTSFIIEPDGTMTEEKAFHIDVRDYLPVEVVNVLTPEERAAEKALYDQMKTEAVRVLSLFNEKWLPAVVNGQPVRCLYNYPISFNIE